MNDEKTNKIIQTDELDNVLPKYDPIKLSGKNLAQQYVSAFNTGMNIYQCVNQLQGYIEWVVKAVNDVVKSWNTEVSESIDQSKAIVRETTTEQFNVEWENKQPELIEQVNRLTTNQFNNEKSIFNDKLDALDAFMDTFSNPNLLINPDFKINQRGNSTYSSANTKKIYTVDRWNIYNANLNASTKVLTNPNSNSGQFKQTLELPLIGTYTVTIKASGVSGNVYFFINENDTNIIDKSIISGLNTVTFTSTKGVSEVGVLISSGASLQIDYVKLEHGAFATPFIAPSPVEEYPKCQRYFQYIQKLYCVPLIYTKSLINNSDKFFQTTNGNLPTEMRITPTLTYNSLGQSDNSTFTGSASFELTSKSIDTVTLDREISNFTITINGITLDAEIY